MQTGTPTAKPQLKYNGAAVVLFVKSVGFNGRILSLFQTCKTFERIVPFLDLENKNESKIKQNHHHSDPPDIEPNR